MSYIVDKAMSTRVIINEKMRCLDDFGICSYDDSSMRNTLKKLISDNPDKDPQQLIDYYCRPMIYGKVWSYE